MTNEMTTGKIPFNIFCVGVRILGELTGLQYEFLDLAGPRE